MSEFETALRSIIRQELGAVLREVTREVAREAIEAERESLKRLVTSPASVGHPSTATESVWLTTTEAADFARVRRQHLSEALISGELHGYQRIPGKAGHRGSPWKIQRSCLDAWLMSRPCPHAPS